MTGSVKVIYFFVALFAMACLAVASVLLAEGRGSLSATLYGIAFVVIGIGFIARKRILRQQK
ncbi:hypothetical protein LLE49_03820 [Alicyclobacillus tolerans]|uniref:hypothetical protein n=1 Tax=Alicyclobacillus tolerans TaxID=90970 RepID=UPI001F26C0B6|nr:hypothetical protein [Alicyclobacillus tolerans]MCF8563868.1 hypothetical protein [Alicyclobacillus tolerans]